MCVRGGVFVNLLTDPLCIAVKTKANRSFQMELKSFRAGTCKSTVETAEGLIMVCQLHKKNINSSCSVMGEGRGAETKLPFRTEFNGIGSKHIYTLSYKKVCKQKSD